MVRDTIEWYDFIANVVHQIWELRHGRQCAESVDIWVGRMPPDWVSSKISARLVDLGLGEVAYRFTVTVSTGAMESASPKIRVLEAPHAG